MLSTILHEQSKASEQSMLT